MKLSLGGRVHDPTDPTDPVGRLLFNVLTVVAKFEADLARARTREGWRWRWRRAGCAGSSPKLKPRQEAHLVELYRGWAHRQRA